MNERLSELRSRRCQSRINKKKGGGEEREERDFDAAIASEKNKERRGARWPDSYGFSIDSVYKTAKIWSPWRGGRDRPSRCCPLIVAREGKEREREKELVVLFLSHFRTDLRTRERERD